MFDVACLGIVVADIVARPVAQLPARGQLALVERMELHTGGCAANTGIALAKLGRRVTVLGKVGQDGLGDFICHALRAHGVDTKGVLRDAETNTAATMVMVDAAGERSFLHYLGADASLCADDVDFGLVEQARILHVAGTFLMPTFDGWQTAEVLMRAQQLGVKTSLDTAWDSTGQWLSTIEPALSCLDYFIPSLEEASHIAGRGEPEAVADFFLGYGIEIVALKMGAEGCFIKSTTGHGAPEVIRLPAYQVEMVDATGAGDCFAAGFLAGLSMGWGLERTGRLANGAGAACVMAMGATSGVRSLKETVAIAGTGQNGHKQIPPRC
jgi:sugar/nucleoside kinase (ribokinase family)